MKKINIFLLASIGLILNSCSIISGVFKAGIEVGIFMVLAMIVVIVVLIIWLISVFKGKG